MADLYQLLAVPPSASAQQLRSAYRAQLRRHHPDRFRAGSSAHQQACAVTRALVAAWEVLGEPGTRAAYDAGLGRPATRHADPTAPPPAAPPPAAAPPRARLVREADPVALLRRQRIEQRYADVLGQIVEPAPARPVATDPGATLRLVLVALAWVAGAVWAVHVSRLLGADQPDPGAWLTALGLGALLVGPWWFLSRAVPVVRPSSR